MIKHIFEIGDLVEYNGSNPDLSGRIGIVTDCPREFLRIHNDQMVWVNWGKDHGVLWSSPFMLTMYWCSRPTSSIKDSIKTLTDAGYSVTLAKI